jgi:hypothetical protein
VEAFENKFRHSRRNPFITDLVVLRVRVNSWLVLNVESFDRLGGSGRSGRSGALLCAKLGHTVSIEFLDVNICWEKAPGIHHWWKRV